MNLNLNNYLIMFLIMFISSIFLNPMNILAYKLSHIYVSLTLIYSSLFMASNMIWIHEIINYVNFKLFNMYAFFISIVLSALFAFILRKQLFVSDKQWLKRMISHHSTAITTSSKKKSKTKNQLIKSFINDIINTQKKEIRFMKSLL